MLCHFPARFEPAWRVITPLDEFDVISRRPIKVLLKFRERKQQSPPSNSSMNSERRNISNGYVFRVCERPECLRTTKLPMIPELYELLHFRMNQT